MSKLIIKTSHGKDFACNKLPKLFLKLILVEFKNPENRYIFTYIQKYYKLNQSQIYEILKTAFIISRVGTYYIIDFDSNVKITEDINVGQIIRLIDCGNKSVRGTQIFFKTFKYIIDKIDDLARLALLKGDSRIWQ